MIIILFSQKNDEFNGLILIILKYPCMHSKQNLTINYFNGNHRSISQPCTVRGRNLNIIDSTVDGQYFVKRNFETSI